MKWTIAAISKFCRTGSGGTPLRSKAERYYSGHIPWVKSGELYADLITETEEYITDEAIAESSAKLVPAGALLVAMYGATVGQTAILGIEAATNQAICHIVPDERIATVRYIWYSLRFKLPELLSLRVGGAQPNINQQIIRNTLISLPPISEQRRIVEILDRADALRKKRAEADAKAERILTALFIKMFGDPVSNTMGWEVVSMSKLYELPPNYGTMIPPNLDEGDWLDLRVANIQNDSLSLESKKYVNLPPDQVNRYEVLDGDLLLARAIGSAEHLGKCIVAYPGNQKWAFDSHLMRIRFQRDLVQPEFVRSFLLTPGGRQLFLEKTRKSAVQFNINTKEFSSIILPLPPLKLQHEFIEKLNQLRALKTKLTEVNHFINHLFETLLQRAFSGDLTAKWREAHITEIIAEMEQQAKIIGTTTELNYEQLALIETQ